MQISKCLKAARVKKNITQEDLAEKLGVSRQTISSWENGKSYPDIGSIIKMSDIFAISLDKLLKEDEELISSLKENTDAVKSNKAIIFTILLGLIFYGGIYLIKTYWNIPKIDNLWLNIIVSILFVICIFTFIWKNINISNFLNKKTSNKSIIKTIITMLMIITIFLIFPYIENITTITKQIFMIRIGIVLLLSVILLFLFKKIDKF